MREQNLTQRHIFYKVANDIRGFLEAFLGLVGPINQSIVFPVEEKIRKQQIWQPLSCQAVIPSAPQDLCFKLVLQGCRIRDRS